ncbi:MAG: hypothetical protein NT045_03390, partial [Candidatus Aureabacteria bacterium]|nr:hypothetical protein [Candidatus Auribacterota bacterium]
VGDPRLRSALLSSLKGGNSRVKCLHVDGVSIFSQPGRFLSICERMRVRGDALFALTAFNEDLSTLTGAAAGSIPSDMSDRVFIRHWNRLWAIPEDRARSAG